MDDSRIYLGVVCGQRNEGGRLLEDVWRRKIFFQEILAPYACIACSSPIHVDLDISIILST